MNADTVAQWLDRAGVPAQAVSIGAEADNAWCLLRRDPDGTGVGNGTGGASGEGDGSAGRPEWEVFWREQGNRYDWARFSSEQMACCYLFGRLAWTQLASGALRPVEPVMPLNDAR